jgi:hypothetical protein
LFEVFPRHGAHDLAGFNIVKLLLKPPDKRPGFFGVIYVQWVRHII